MKEGRGRERDSVEGSTSAESMSFDWTEEERNGILGCGDVGEVE